LSDVRPLRKHAILLAQLLAYLLAERNSIGILAEPESLQRGLARCLASRSNWREQACGFDPWVAPQRSWCPKWLPQSASETTHNVLIAIAFRLPSTWEGSKPFRGISGTATAARKKRVRDLVLAHGASDNAGSTRCNNGRRRPSISWRARAASNTVAEVEIVQPAPGEDEAGKQAGVTTTLLVRRRA
jgi:hypothetical protein